MIKRLWKYAMMFVLGASVGAVGTWLYFRPVIAQIVFDSAAGNVLMTTSKLMRARSGDYDLLIRDMESELTAHIIGLLAAEPYLSERQLNLVLAADRYYKKYPASIDDNEYKEELGGFLQKLSQSPRSATR